MADAFNAEIRITAKDLATPTLSKMSASVAAVGKGWRGLSGISFGRLDGSLHRISTTMQSVSRNSWRAASAVADLGAAVGRVAGSAALSTLHGAMLGMAAGVGGMAASLKIGADSLEDLGRVAERVGLSVRDLRNAGQVGLMEGLSIDQTNRSLQTAAENFMKLRTGVGGVADRVDDLAPGLSRQIAAANSNADAFNLMFEAVHQAVKSGRSSLAAELSETFFGNAEMMRVARMSAAAYRDELEKADKLRGPIDDRQVRNAVEFNKSVRALGASLLGIRDGVTNEVLPALTPMFKAWANWLSDDGNRTMVVQEIGGAIRAFGDVVGKLKWAEIGQGLKDIGAGLREVASGFLAVASAADTAAKAIGGWAVVLGALAAVKVANMLRLPSLVSWLAGGSAAGAAAGAAAGSGAGAAAGTATAAGGAGVAAWFAAMMAKMKALSAASAPAIAPYLLGATPGETFDEQVELQRKRREALRNALPSWGDFLFGKAAQPGFNLRDQMRIDLNGVPQRALGGPMQANRWTLVGERGPELVQFPQAGHVYDADKTRSMLSPGGGSTADAREFGRALLAPARIIAAPFRPLGDLIADLSRTMGDLLDVLRNGESFGGGGGYGGGLGAVSSPSALAGAIRNGNILTIPQSLRDAALPLQSISAPWAGGEPKTAADFKAYLMSRHGRSNEQAAGIVGNLIQESGLRTTAVGDGGTSFGVAQWHKERFTNLKRFASGMGSDWRKASVQLDFLDHELKTSESAAGRALNRASSVEAATAAMIGFERPQGWSPGNPQGGHGWRNRLANAYKVAALPAARPAMSLPPQIFSGAPMMPASREDVRPAVRYDRRDGHAGRVEAGAPASLGEGMVRVIVSDDRVSVTSGSRGPVRVKAGVDSTGQTNFRPSPVARGGRPLTGGM